MTYISWSSDFSLYLEDYFWCLNSILWDYESVWPDVGPKNKCRSLWPIFHGPVILPYLEDCLMYEHLRLFDVWTSLFRIMSHYDKTFDLRINVGYCGLYFMVQWFCFITWRLFDICTPYFGIMSQYDPMLDLKINVGHCDLYFMVQWFYHISWRLFDVWTSYFRIRSQLQWPHIWPQNKWRSLWHISWSIDFALYLEGYLLHEHHTLGLWVSMTWHLTSK